MLFTIGTPEVSRHRSSRTNVCTQFSCISFNAYISRRIGTKLSRDVLNPTHVPL